MEMGRDEGEGGGGMDGDETGGEDGIEGEAAANERDGRRRSRDARTVFIFAPRASMAFSAVVSADSA